MSHDIDIVTVSDFRFPGGTSVSIAEEVRAQAQAGYSTALAQVFGPLVAKHRGFNPAIRECLDRGEARLVNPGESLRARVAILRHPSVFLQMPDPRPRIQADEVILVANQAATTVSGIPHYDPLQVDAVITEMFGRRPTWAPIGPLVRANLAATGVGIQTRAEDWVNLIDVDEWAVERTQWRSYQPVIGRHSRPQPAKWPATREELLAAYPTDGSVDVRVLGGAAPAEQLLGEGPVNWTVERFGARHPRDFLADIDFFVYYHHPDWVEAFGRNVLEALASGAVAVVDPALGETFAEAAIVVPPEQAMGQVRRLRAHPEAYAQAVHRGRDWVRARYGHEVHVRRLEELLGASARGRTQRRPVAAQVRLRHVVLFVSSNGAGMGHLTRLLAMARRASDDVQPVFLSLSQAVPVVGNDGFPYEYFPSRAGSDMSTRDWNRLFAERFRMALRQHRPRAVVFDGTWPYQGIIDVRPEFPDIAFVWSRRAMWRAGTAPEQLQKSQSFDLVIEPGEVAAEADTGPTTRVRDAVRVGPVTYIEPTEVLDREQAAQELGLDPALSTVLVTLGAGNINDLASGLRTVIGFLSDCANIQIAVTHSMIATQQAGLDTHIHRVSVYPLSRYLRAFDFAVAAAGYNSYHELLAGAVPTMFVPNMETRTDDQLARARFAAGRGLGLYTQSLTTAAVNDCMRILLDRDERETMTRRCHELSPSNGAAEAMQAIERAIRARSGAS
jgi:UDP:flavonoid glycosyltransferase YjiC (YdhE family)